MHLLRGGEGGGLATNAASVQRGYTENSYDIDRVLCNAGGENWIDNLPSLHLK